MSIVCWRTTASASSSRRAWSSTGGGDAIVEAQSGRKGESAGAWRVEVESKVVDVVMNGCADEVVRLMPWRWWLGSGEGQPGRDSWASFLHQASLHS
jgi:hypothetical protein